MEAQAELGIDVITDGEVDRGAYYIHIMNNIQVYFNLMVLLLCKKELYSSDLFQ